MLIGMISTLRDNFWLSDYTSKIINNLDGNGIFVRSLVDECEYVQKDNQKIIESSWDSIDKTSQSCDILHLQWLSGLYENNFLEKIIKINKPLVITLHDSNIPKFLIDAATGCLVFNEYAPRDAGVLLSNSYSTFVGLNNEKYYEPPVGRNLKVLALGNGYDIEKIELACALSNEAFRGEYRFELNTYRNNKYNYNNLINNIVASHIVIMMYPYNSGNQTSYVAYSVSDCCRPLIVSDTEWFYRLSSLYALRANTEHEIADHIVDVAENYGNYLDLARMYKKLMIEELGRTWELAARTYTGAYNEIFSY